MQCLRTVVVEMKVAALKQPVVVQKQAAVACWQIVDDVAGRSVAA